MIFRRAPTPLVVAGACAAAAALVWVTAYHLTPFKTLDHRTLDGFVGLLGPATAGPASRISRLVDPGPFALFSAALVLVAIARRRPRTAIAIAAVLAGATVTAEVLKPALALPRVAPDIGTATWPSGHATAAMALVLCLQLAIPSRLRPAAAAVGGLFVLGIVYSVLILDHHEPSDVVGGFLVAGAWTGLAVTGLRAAGERRPARAAADPAPRTVVLLVPAGIAAAVLTLAVSVLVVVHWSEALDYAATHTTFVAGAAFIALGALGMSTAASLSLTRT